MRGNETYRASGNTHALAYCGIVIKRLTEVKFDGDREYVVTQKPSS